MHSNSIKQQQQPQHASNTNDTAATPATHQQHRPTMGKNKAQGHNGRN